MLRSGRHLRSHNADIKHHSQIIYRQIVLLREQPQLSEQRPPSLFFSHSLCRHRELIVGWSDDKNICRRYCCEVANLILDRIGIDPKTYRVHG